jgi:hypothetical protein
MTQLDADVNILHVKRIGLNDFFVDLVYIVRVDKQHIKLKDHA